MGITVKLKITIPTHSYSSDLSISAISPDTIREKVFNIRADSDYVRVLLPAQNELRTSHICMASLLSGCECES